MNFDTFNNILINEPIFAHMKTVAEDSPYHRESSIFEHTMMVCDEFDKHYSQLNDDYFIGLFACLFHDIGKPACRTPKYNEARGHYFSYDYHDIESSKQANSIMIKYASFSAFDIVRICWMIEHHTTFWTIKDNDKRANLAKDFRNPGISINFECFKTFMIADDFGRICEARTIDSVKYFDEFEREYMNN